MSKLWVTIAYAALFAIAVITYIRFPTHRDEIKFWLPQALLALTLIMTSLYVLLTAELVAETKRLQQRPLLELRFVEVETEKCTSLKFSELYSHGLGVYQGLARKMIEGEKMPDPPKSLVVELKNIGQTPARSIVVGIRLDDPVGSKREQMNLLQSLGKDEAMQVLIVPALLPYGRIQVENLSYGDGLRNYSDISGERSFELGKF